MIIRGTFPLLRRRARQTRGRLALLVEAEVVQLSLKRREPVVPEIDGQRRLEALSIMNDDAAVGVPRQYFPLLLEHLVQFYDEIVRGHARELLGEGGARRGGAGRRGLLRHGVFGLGFAI